MAYSLIQQPALHTRFLYVAADSQARMVCVEQNRQNAARVKYWEIIADNLKKVGWSLGWVSAVDLQGRTIWIADAHRGDGKRFVVLRDEKLTAFLELETVMPSSERLSFKHAVFAFALFFRQQVRELLGAVSRGLLDCPRRL